MSIHSDIKTALLAIVAAAAFIAAAFVSVAPSKSGPVERLVASANSRL